jgi:endonuclease/exonuclease/phosphatase family metal-dependent hydrolase
MLFRTASIAGCALRTLGETVFAICIMLVCCLSPAQAENGRSIKIMTQNMDAGTDLTFILGMENMVEAAQLTYQEITDQSHIPQRARNLAAQISDVAPDLVALQEATIWALRQPGRTKILYNQLDLLLKALDEYGAHYVVVATQPLTKAEAPLDYGMEGWLQFNDSNVILARADGKYPVLNFSNVMMDRYTRLFTFGPLVEVLGWMSVDVEVLGRKIRFFNTHLAGTFSPEIRAVQIDQGDELITVLNASPYPVILAGDFNSDSSPLKLGPDLTPTTGNMSSAGYTDVWQKLRSASDYGLTWPRYQEDIYPIPPSQPVTTPTERIDLIYEKGLIPLSIKLICGTRLPLSSDHMGVMATLQADK